MSPLFTVTAPVVHASMVPQPSGVPENVTSYFSAGDGSPMTILHFRNSFASLSFTAWFATYIVVCSLSGRLWPNVSKSVLRCMSMTLSADTPEKVMKLSSVTRTSRGTYSPESDEQPTNALLPITVTPGSVTFPSDVLL